jgi:hypothetical protein
MSLQRRLTKILDSATRRKDRQRLSLRPSPRHSEYTGENVGRRLRYLETCFDVVGTPQDEPEHAQARALLSLAASASFMEGSTLLGTGYDPGQSLKILIGGRSIGLTSCRNARRATALLGQRNRHRSRTHMGFGRGVLLWLVGIPLPIIPAGPLHASLNRNSRCLESPGLQPGLSLFWNHRPGIGLNSHADLE